MSHYIIPDDWLRAAALEGFWRTVDRTGDCWIWTGQVHSKRWGYGSLHILGKRFLAHRFIWMMLHGPIPAGMLICHSCDNPMCVRPEHLFMGTSQDNMVDMVNKGRGNLKRKLTIEQVREIRIRAESGESQAALAREFQVRPQSVFKIVKRIGWRWLD